MVEDRLSRGVAEEHVLKLAGRDGPHPRPLRGANIGDVADDVISYEERGDRNPLLPLSAPGEGAGG